MGCPGSWRHHPGLVGVPFSRQVFPALERGFLFSMQTSYHVQSALLDLSGNEGFRTLVRSWSPPRVCAHFSISFLCLPWTVLCLSPGTRTRTFAPEKGCPISARLLLQPHLVFSHHNPCLFSTILGCYYQQSMVGFTAKELWAFGTCTSASYLLGFHTIAAYLSPFSHYLFISTLLV